MTAHQPPSSEVASKRVSIGVVLVAILFLIPLFKYLNLVGGQLLGAVTNISFIMAFMIGLVAAFSTCMATMGVFFLSVNEELKRDNRQRDSLGFTMFFSTGRVLAYAVFGGLIGFFGKSFLLNPKISGLLTVIIFLQIIVIAFSLISDRITLWRLHSQKLVGFLLRFAQRQPLVAPLVLGAVSDDRGQTIEMAVDRSGYAPRAFTVKKGLPVTWKIQGTNIYGCQSFLVVPDLNISRQIVSGENIVEFTPQKTGKILFFCGMGMFRGLINVI